MAGMSGSGPARPSPEPGAGSTGVSLGDLSPVPVARHSGDEEVVMLRHGLARLLPIIALATVALAGPAAALDVGDKAPDFVLNAPGGKQVKLADLLGKGPVVLYTFIGAFNGL